MILCLGTTPAAQRVMIFRKLTLDAVNRAATTLDGVAGKSINVAKVLRALGEKPVAIGFLGGDRGKEIQADLEACGITHEFVATGVRTRQCITVIDESQGTQTELVEESRPVPPVCYEQLRDILQRRIAGCRALVMSGTLTPDGPLDFYARGVQLAHKHGILSVADAAGAPMLEALKARPGLIKPNRPELAATVGRELLDENAVLQAMAEIIERGAERVVVTSGKAPALATDGQKTWRIHAPEVKALNPIGSGDAFTAALTACLVRGDDLGEACRWGAAAGAANAMTLMAGEVDRATVEQLVRAVRMEQVAQANK